VRTNNFHGFTANSNFTYGRAMGTSVAVQATSSATPLDPFNLGANYGPQGFDYKFIYNLSMYYAPPVFKGQKGILGHALGGWNFSPLFTAISGAPLGVTYSEGSCSGCEAFGEVTTPGTSAVGATSEEAVGFSPYTGGTSAHYNIPGGTGSNIIFGTNAVGTKTPIYGINMFSNPAAVYSEFRPCVLGFDTSCGGYDNLRGQPTWNLDMTVVKDLAIYKERLGAMMFFTFTNILNHFQPGNPSLSLTSPTSFGQITGQANTPRSMEFGLRLRF